MITSLTGTLTLSAYREKHGCRFGLRAAAQRPLPESSDRALLLIEGEARWSARGANARLLGIVLCCDPWDLGRWIAALDTRSPGRAFRSHCETRGRVDWDAPYGHRAGRGKTLACG